MVGKLVLYDESITGGGGSYVKGWRVQVVDVYVCVCLWQFGQHKVRNN